jgi:SAM-dependent methyltransferase
MSSIALRKGGSSLHLQLEHSADNGVHTGGHLWVSSCYLAQWLYEQPQPLHGVRVLELGCGLGLPSLVAAKLGASVVATDALELLLVKLRANATLNGCPHIGTRVLDFGERPDVELARKQGTDLVLFSDCVHGGQGWSLPSALVLLLCDTPRARAVGAFPTAIRAGVERFWTEASRVGLQWRELGRASNGSSRLYEFMCSAEAHARDDWGTHVDNAEALSVGLTSIFDGIE